MFSSLGSLEEGWFKFWKINNMVHKCKTQMGHLLKRETCLNCSRQVYPQGSLCLQIMPMVYCTTFKPCMVQCWQPDRCYGHGQHCRFVLSWEYVYLFIMVGPLCSHFQLQPLCVMLAQCTPHQRNSSIKNVHISLASNLGFHFPRFTLALVIPLDSVRKTSTLPKN